MILFLKPYFSQKPWAGKELNKIYDCPDNTGEAWIISGYLNKSSTIANGKYKGQTLRHLWNKHPELFGNFPDKEFPLLIKLISSSSDLSVQVHPNDDYARQFNQYGKFECWYILPETKAKDIVLGINAKNALEVENMLKDNTVENYLINQPIKANDLVVVEPGTVHAIKANTFVLEVQEASDITYRLYDYNRLPKRELHIKDSLNVINYTNLRNNIYDFSKEDTLKNSHFNLYKLIVNGKTVYENKGFEIFYVLNGKGNIDGTNITKGNSFILTNNKEQFNISGDNLELIAVIPKPKGKERLNLRKIALITGIVGQDGYYLTDLLLSKGYEVHGIIQSKSQIYNDTIKKLTLNDNVYNKTLFLHIGDLTDTSNLSQLLESIKPDEIYHLAGQNHVDLSFDMPEYTADVNALGTLRLLDAIKRSEYRTKLFNLSTCQLFDGEIYPQNEETKFNPTSPYAVSKLYAHEIVKCYRKNYKLYAVNGIFYNHESPLRDFSFLSKKVCEYVKSLKNGYIKPLKLGNIYAKREWGHAKDYAYAMWQMLQLDKPEDFIVSTGLAYMVKEFVENAFAKINIHLSWQGEGINEKGIGQDGTIYVEISQEFMRPNDAKVLAGDSTLFRNKTSWKPEYDLDKLLDEMLED